MRVCTPLLRLSHVCVSCVRLMCVCVYRRFVSVFLLRPYRRYDEWDPWVAKSGFIVPFLPAIIVDFIRQALSKLPDDDDDDDSDGASSTNDTGAPPTTPRRSPRLAARRSGDDGDGVPALKMPATASSPSTTSPVSSMRAAAWGPMIWDMKCVAPIPCSEFIAHHHRAACT